MITTLSDALFERLLAAARVTEPVDRGRIARSGLPAPISHFLELTLARRVEIETESLVEIAAPWIDYGQDEIRIGREAYVRLLARHAHFPAGEWPRALKHATTQITSHLVRPVETLVQFVFGDETQELPAVEIERRVSFFMAFSYLRTAVGAYLERHRRESISRRQLGEMLSHVDHAMTADWSVEQWSAALAPLEQLSRIAGFDGVPGPLLESFYEAKGHQAVAARVRSWAQAAGRDAVSLDELPGALTPRPDPVPEARPIAAPPIVARPVAGPPVEARPIAARPAEQRPIAVPPVEARSIATPTAETAAAQPLWKQFARQGAEPSAEPSADIPLWKKFRSALDETPHPPALAALEKDLLGSAAGRRTEFVRNLFDGSEEAYGRTLGGLRQARNWPEASRILADEVFRRYRVDIYSPVAVAFTDALEARFRYSR